MATTQTELQTSKAIEIINSGLPPVLLGRVGERLKIPQLKDWQLTEYSRGDVARWPAGNNIGVRCGKMRDGRYLYVFDFDKNADDIFPAWLAAAGKILPDPVIVSTGKGYHVYLITDEPQKHGIFAGEPVTDDNGRTRSDVLIEVRGDKQQVVSPGSIHPSGRHYELTAGSLATIPTVTNSEYQQLTAMAAAYDKRPAKKPASNVTNWQHLKATGGDLAGVHNCLDYARAHIAGDEQKERDGQIRILGNGGLLITADGSQWYCHAEQFGGGLVSLIAWHKNISVGAAVALLRPAPTKQQAGGLATPGELVDDFWQGQDPVMVAPMQMYFEEKFPHEWTQPHTCNNYMDVRDDENGMAVSKRHTAKIWRDRRAGDLQIDACPGCQHDYVMKACWQLEVEAGAYPHDEMPFRYQILKIHQVKKLIRAARRIDGFTLRYWKRPLMGGRVAIIHNIDDLKLATRKAHELPRNRTKLYELVMGWITDVDASRTSHSKGWGGEFKGTRGDGREDKETRFKSTIHVITEWQRAHDAIADYLRVAHVANNHGLHIVKFLDILDGAGVRYGIQRGQDELKEMRRSYNVHSSNDKANSTMYASHPEATKQPPQADFSDNSTEYEYVRLLRLARERREMAMK